MPESLAGFTSALIRSPVKSKAKALENTSTTTVFRNQAANDPQFPSGSGYRNLFCGTRVRINISLDFDLCFENRRDSSWTDNFVRSHQFVPSLEKETKSDEQHIQKNQGTYLRVGSDLDSNADFYSD